MACRFAQARLLNIKFFEFWLWPGLSAAILLQQKFFAGFVLGCVIWLADFYKLFHLQRNCSI